MLFTVDHHSVVALHEFPSASTSRAEKLSKMLIECQFSRRNLFTDCLQHIKVQQTCLPINSQYGLISTHRAASLQIRHFGLVLHAGDDAGSGTSWCPDHRNFPYSLRGSQTMAIEAGRLRQALWSHTLSPGSALSCSDVLVRVPCDTYRIWLRVQPSGSDCTGVPTLRPHDFVGFYRVMRTWNIVGACTYGPLVAIISIEMD